MKINHSLMFLLFISQTMPQTDGNCLYNADLRHCSCSFVDLSNLVSIVTCIQASSFEFRGGRFIDTHDYIPYSVEMEQVLAMIRLPLTKVSFVNAALSEEFLSTFLRWISRIPIEVLAFENTNFVGKSNWQHITGSLPRISSLQFINVSSYPLFDRASSFTALSDWVYKLKGLTLKKSNLKSIPCNATLLFDELSTLDLSENLLQDVSNVFCHGSFPKLKSLVLRNNNFGNYNTVCQMLNTYSHLVQLDLSQNRFSNMSSSSCKWRPSLMLLNLSDTGLEDTNNDFPQSCETLDLSYNKLEYLNVSLPNLKELYLSHNRFHTMPTMAKLPSLLTLAIDGNPMNMLQLSHLQEYKCLISFRADNIPYECSCSLIHEIKEIMKSGMTLQHWPDGYLCESPISLKGKLVSEVDLSFFECHKPLLTVVICIVVLLVCIASVMCFVKIHRHHKVMSQNLQSREMSSVQSQS
ncbi:monocyte differentiation antigen CD14 [Pelodytes ibericus]